MLRLFSAAFSGGPIQACRWRRKARASNDFPLLLAAAPLKPYESRDSPLFHMCDFPLLLAAAPLKRSATLARSACRRRFSAAFSGGPIEALSFGTPHHRCPSNFPLLLAAAPLKPQAPKLRCPRAEDHFPLLLAAAPLKRASQRQARRLASNFPLLLAAAPLKPVARVIALAPFRRFSAAFSGGPIEAKATLSARHA